jgi:hypothetical protein
MILASRGLGAAFLSAAFFLAGGVEATLFVTVRLGAAFLAAALFAGVFVGGGGLVPSSACVGFVDGSTGSS